MAKEAAVTITLRITRATRDLLREAAERDHRSMANMVEVLILRHCEVNAISMGTKRTVAKGHAR
jgi:uncharacterized protein (DUF1778 family)